MEVEYEFSKAPLVSPEPKSAGRPWSLCRWDCWKPSLQLYRSGAHSVGSVVPTLGAGWLWLLCGGSLSYRKHVRPPGGSDTIHGVKHRPRLKVCEYTLWPLGLPGGQEGKESACKTRDPGLIPVLGRPLEKEMATHSSIRAWSIPQTEESGGLQSTGLQRVRHDWEISSTPEKRAEVQTSREHSTDLWGLWSTLSQTKDFTSAHKDTVSR